MRRMLSERIYPGPRDIFMTNAVWPGRREHMVKLYGESETVWLLDQFAHVAGCQGHVLVRVAAGGEHYHVLVLDDRAESHQVVSVHGPYRSAGYLSRVAQ